MAAASATVHPSHLESLCMAALESLAVQTPILVQGGTEPLRQHCIQGRCGLWYGDVSGFRSAASVLLEDKRLRDALGKNGLQYVRDNYAWPRIVEKYEQIFAFLMSEEGAA
jgi:glycosyltransferase involved in cell wall biosynthesis